MVDSGDSLPSRGHRCISDDFFTMHMILTIVRATRTKQRVVRAMVRLLAGFNRKMLQAFVKGIIKRGLRETDIV